MKLEDLITQPINVTLDWDSTSLRTQIGKFEGEMHVEHERCDIYFDLYMSVLRETDNGDYFNPPEFEDSDIDIEIFDISVVSVGGDEITLTPKQVDILANDIKEHIDYE